MPKAIYPISHAKTETTIYSINRHVHRFDPIFLQISSLAADLLAIQSARDFLFAARTLGERRQHIEQTGEAESMRLATVESHREE